MSYDKDINNHTVKFKDEKSYLNCKLDYIIYCEEKDFSVGFEPTFFVFIEAEMYRGFHCEVESIELVQYAGITEAAVSIDPNGNYTYTTNDSDPIDFALGGGNQSGTVPISIGSYGSYSSYIIGADYGVDTGVVDGIITEGGNTTATFNYTLDPLIEIPKVEEPEDPIDNRFDILDL